MQLLPSCKFYNIFSISTQSCLFYYIITHFDFFGGSSMPVSAAILCTTLPIMTSMINPIYEHGLTLRWLQTSSK